MFEVIDALSTFNQFTLVTVGVVVCMAIGLIREITDSTGLAFLAAPALFLGGMIANYLFRTRFVIATVDKDANIVIATAVGVVCALVLLLVAIWIGVVLSEHRSKKQKFMQLPEVTRAGK